MLLSASGTASQIVLDTLGTRLNMGFDVFTGASVVIGYSAPAPTINLDVVGPNGSVDFPFIPNLTTLLGLPIWAAGLTITPQATAGRFTDPIRFQ